MKKHREPSQKSLKEMPEIDLTRVRRLPRGKYATRAARSFHIALIEQDVWRHFASSEAVNEALRTLVRAAHSHASRSNSR